MEKLWSPWRSAYIESFKDKKQTEDTESLFTSLLKDRDDKKNYLLYRGKHCFIIMNLYPYNSGHLMIVPNREIKGLEEMTAEEKLEMLKLLELSMKALDKAMKPHGYNIGANIGKAAGAGIENHLHFHIVPRWVGDTNFMPVLNDIKVVSEEMEKTYEKLKKAIEELVK
jgi:ATP adenylyltransferase